MVRKAGASLPGVLIALVVVLSSTVSAASPCATEQGQILLPTGSMNPPPIVDELMEPFLVWYITIHIVTKNYHLYPLGSSVGTICVQPPSCVPYRINLPEFNIAWYDSSDALIIDHDWAGPKQTSVPAGSAYGVVYMPHVTEGASDGSAVFGRFQYDQYC